MVTTQARSLLVLVHDLGVDYVVSTVL
ncbi:MAG: hypothetical protein K0R87_2793, partial [Pseudonocardia sp.]|nr:hypothetical protein [Pseudonocardia sp.]